MNKIKKILYKIIYSGFILGIFLYLGSIIWINLCGQEYLNYDMYSDAMFAKYMSESGSFFPDSWVFGNQYYIVATPVVGALINFFLKDAYLSLGLASCVMTLLTVGSYIWCVKPFVSNKSMIVGLFCLIGGTILGENAAIDENGLQVFFTMASYYSCYIIGILFTLGIWLRLYTKKDVHLFYIVIAVLLNLSFGMQSLRELLVLNIPLCMLIIYNFFLKGKLSISKISKKNLIVFFILVIEILLNLSLDTISLKHRLILSIPLFMLAIVLYINKKNITKNDFISKENLFTVTMLIANLLGTFLIRLFIKIFKIKSHSILEDISYDLCENIKYSFKEFLNYIHLAQFNTSIVGIFLFISAIFILLIVLYSVFSILKSRSKDPVAFFIIFCLLSLFATFLSGIFVIRLRPIYFFVWNLLVTFSFVYISEKFFEISSERKYIYHKFYIISISILLFVGFGNYYLNFKSNFENYNAKREFYREVTNKLKNDKIKYIYSDCNVFEMGGIPACSNGDIIWGIFNFETESNNLLSHVGYLCSNDWYNSENSKDSYIMFSDKSLDYLNNSASDEYRNQLLSNLTLKYKAEYNLGETVTTYYFYKGSDKIYNDLMKNQS